MKISVLGAGAGGAAAVAELKLAGHAVTLWNRSADTLAGFLQAGAVGYTGVLGEGLAACERITTDISEATRDSDAAVVCLPTFSHGHVARVLAASDWSTRKPVILNPGHTGGALEFAAAWREIRPDLPPIAEFSTLTYVARKYAAGVVTVTGRARQVRAAALPGGASAVELSTRLFPGARPVADVLASSLCNANLVLHPPGAVLASAWVEATQGDFTFYVQGMTPGVARTMKALDGERRAVAAAFGHDIPNLVGEMKCIGTVEDTVADLDDFVAAIAGGKANSRIKAPDSLRHRYYLEDFGHGLLPFLELAGIAGVQTPVARALFTLGQALVGTDFTANGRTARTMGIAGMTKTQLQQYVRQA